MTAGRCMSSNAGSPPGSPPLNVPPPPLPPLSRAPSLGGGSIGRSGGPCDMSHSSAGVGSVTLSGGCPKCRFSTIATPTHNRHNSNHLNGGVPGNIYSQLGYHHQHMKPSLVTPNQAYGSNQSYSAFKGTNDRYHEEEDSACPSLMEREFYLLHRNVPGLRRAGVDTSTIRQHFYPDGGWGWIVCGVAFLAHVLTTGFQLSYGLLFLYTVKHLGDHEDSMQIGWLGAGSWSMSMLCSTIVVALCRRKSTRLTAVLGGLVIALGILFTSFATQFHQVAFSYGAVVGIGASIVRESAAVMVGHYFKRRRQFVEMIIMSGEGIGIALFSVILKEGVGKMGWRLGLQAVTGLVSCCFFMGILYRPASLYHPQRRAILHLKNQRKKVKEKKTHIQTPKPPFLDVSPFRSSTVRMFIAVSATATVGIYAPIFFLSLHGFQEGYDMQDLVLLQTFLGLSVAAGVVASGSAINRSCLVSYRKFQIPIQYLSQGSLSLVTISLLVMGLVTEYRVLCLVAWTYGLGLGSFRYSMKMFALERIRAKHFTKAWGFIKSAEALPVMFGIPVVSFLNEASTHQQHGRAGYFVCSAATAISTVLLFFVGHPDEPSTAPTGNGSLISHCGLAGSECPELLNRSFNSSSRYAPHCYPSPYSTMTNANARCSFGLGAGGANGYPSVFTPQHHHPSRGGGSNVQMQLPPAYNHNAGNEHYHRNGKIIQGAGSINKNGTGEGGPPQPRLLKSLSFAFPSSSSAPWNDFDHQHRHYCSSLCQQPHQPHDAGANGLGIYSRCYSRCNLHPTSTSFSGVPESRVLLNGATGQQSHNMRTMACSFGCGSRKAFGQPSRSLSVPEGLSVVTALGPSAKCGTCDYRWQQHRSITDMMGSNVQVVEQMTTSV